MSSSSKNLAERILQDMRFTLKDPYLTTAEFVRRLERENLSSDDRLQTLNEFYNFKPKEAAIYTEKQWEKGTLPVTEAILQRYFSATIGHNQGRYQDMNLNELIINLQRLNPSIGHSMNVDATGGVFSSMNQTGLTKSNPIHVVNTKEVSYLSYIKQALILLTSVFFIGALYTYNTKGSTQGNKQGGGVPSPFGQSKAAVHMAEKPTKTFNDVVGVDEAKDELKEIVMFLKNPQKFTRLGGKLPKGVLLTGPPGTGKTLLARAIAGEAGVPFFYSTGSEFDEMFVGMGAKRIRELFEAAKKHGNAIIFIDEIDAVGGTRNLRESSTSKQTLNQLLTEMDGFEQNSGVIVIGATNFPDVLDAALVRPGRFDRHVTVPLPDIKGRKEILSLYTKKVPINKDVDIDQIARGTPGFSGADLANLVNQAALKSALDGLSSVTMEVVEWAKDKIMMGAERKTAIISEETMKMTSFHEAGHALVALKTDGSNPIHKATIMPRGRALGMVMQLPDGDQTSQSRKQMLAYIDICMGGRVAEELIYGKDNVTSGASSDLMQATRLAHQMITLYGFSDKIGIYHVNQKRSNSNDTLRDVDNEIRSILADSYKRAKNILETYRGELDIIAHGLREYETLSGDEIAKLLKGVKPSTGGRSMAPSRPLKPLPEDADNRDIVNRTSNRNN